jgi:Protein of unknown function (DUF3300)
MQRKPSLCAVLFLVTLIVFQGLAPELQAQAAPPPTPQQLDQLLAPIALYPDALLAQITTASTNPQEILDVDNWLAENHNLSVSELTAAAQQQGFDPAFIALVGFPQVLQMMADNVDDYAAIGAAVTANQAEVSASIQRLRAQAYASGALRSSPQQQVVVQPGPQPIYVIQPANPQVVYVPQYDPTVVYAGSGLNVGLLTFGIGIGITALMVSQPWGWGGWGWNWGARRVYYNRAPWGGWNGGYRPPNGWYRPRPVPYNGRPGYGGNWGYRPPNYRPPRPIRYPSYTRPGTRPGYNRPGTRPGYNRPVNGNRPPNGGRPTIQPVRPGTPGYNRPVNGGRPPNGGRPTIQPVQPGTPGNRPGNGGRPPNGGRPTIQPVQPTTRPANRVRVTPQNRPAPQQNRPAPQQNRPAPQQNRAAPRPLPQRPPQGGNGDRGPR